MSNSVLIIGPSGSGKSTSIRTLDSDSTYVLNVLGKPLPFRGYKKQYNVDKKNYYQTDDWTKIIKCIRGVNEERPDIKTLVIDDLQYLMANEFMRRASEHGYSKFTELAQHIWCVINELTNTRDDLFTFTLSHNELDANGKYKCKTIGKLLDEKITIEGMFTCVFHSMVVDDKFKFLTQNDGIHIAKTPMGMFDSKLIDNDLNEVIKKMKEYEE